VQIARSQTPAPAPLRIGAVARRLGLAPDTIRAWERRYGVVEPARSEGGTRLYSPADLDRLRLMMRDVAAGIAPSEAARRALALTAVREEGAPDPDDEVARGLAGEVLGAVGDLDEPALQVALDRLIATFSTEFVLRDVLVPLYLDVVAGVPGGPPMGSLERRFATTVLRGRLLGLARGWGEGTGPLAVIACAPGEHRDLALICFGLAVHAHGWRVVFLGADVPVPVLREASRRLAPSLLLVAACEPRLIEDAATDLRALANEAPLAVVGRGIARSLAERTGAPRFRHDPVSAAERVAAGLPG
jgi:hypothetical protein